MRSGLIIMIIYSYLCSNILNVFIYRLSFVFWFLSLLDHGMTTRRCMDEPPDRGYG